MIFSLNKGINKAPDTFVQAISDSMPRATFERILQNLDLCDYEPLLKEGKFPKLRPMIKKEISKVLLKRRTNTSNKSMVL